MMDQDTKNIVSIIAAAALGIALVASAITWPIVYYYSQQTESSMKYGYEQTSLPGVQGVHWTKKK